MVPPTPAQGSTQSSFKSKVLSKIVEINKGLQSIALNSTQIKLLRLLSLKYLFFLSFFFLLLA